MKKNDGGPVFPQTHESWRGANAVPEGIYLRQLFAGLALIGLIVAVPKMPDGDIARQAYGLCFKNKRRRNDESKNSTTPN